MHDETSLGMTLVELRRAGVMAVISGDEHRRVTGVQHDSRRVERGDLFVAVPGEKHDGSTFVDDALGRGAVAVMAETKLPHDVPQMTVDDARLGLGLAAELVCGSPSARLRTIGITGTNGKTTTAYLIKQAIESVGEKAALIGTTGLAVGTIESPSLHTTPEGDDISRFARRSLEEGATHLVIEVSSHGLALRRVDALDFDVAAFTNLSRDHLDFHGTFEAYAEAKARLFTELRPRHSVIHVDDPFGAELANRIEGHVLRCSRQQSSDAEIRAVRWSADRQGVRALIDTPGGSIEVDSPMLGEHNLENLLVALGCAYALGLPLDDVKRAWRQAAGSPGRLERIPHPQDVAVLVDYAHTPDALERALSTMRAITPKRLLAVFGAGGDRDRGKRPQMGRIGVEHADVCVLTSDNPRTEDPAKIAQEVAAGARSVGAPEIELDELSKASRGFCVVLDRRTAIGSAIGAATSGDTVLVAGKGHEDYQIFGTERIHFDDREEARAALASLKGPA